jgi:hypothetical protein
MSTNPIDTSANITRLQPPLIFSNSSNGGAHGLQSHIKIQVTGFDQIQDTQEATSKGDNKADLVAI